MTTVKTRRFGSRWGLVGQIVAIAGILLCAAVILAIWLGRGAIQGGIDELTGSVDQGFQRGIAATVVVTDRLGAAADEVGTIASEAQAIADNPTGGEGRLAELQAKVGRFTEGYRAIRTKYAEIRENVTAALASVQRLARIVPTIEAPQGPGTLAQVDERIVALDERVTGMWPAPGATTAAAATLIAEQATSVQGLVTGASSVVGGLGSDLESARASANGVGERIGGLVIIGATALSLVFVWILLLNVALWWLGHLYRERGRQRGTGPQSELEPNA